MKSKSKNAARNKAWKELSARLRADAGKCEICGETGKRLHAHHILWRRSFPNLLLEERNLICLCARHHFLLHHGHETEFMAWLRRHKPDQWEWIMNEADKFNLFTSTEDDQA